MTRLRAALPCALLLVGCDQSIVLGRAAGPIVPDGGADLSDPGPPGLRFQLGEDRAAGAVPRAVLGVDVDRDGRPDVVVADGAGASVLLLRGQGGGALGATEAVSAGDGPLALGAADLDGDGQLDLLVANERARALAVLRGDGRALRPPASYPLAAAPTALLAADLDGDGRVDAVVAGADGGLTILRNRGDGQGSLAAAPQRPALGAAPIGLAAAPLSQRRLPDLALVQQGGADAAVLRSQGGGAFADPERYRLDQGLRALALADLNGDGRPDLAAAGDAGLLVLPGFGDGWLFNDKGPERYAGPPAAALLAVDLDGDGALDVASADGDAGTVSVLRGVRGGSLQAPLRFAAGGGPAALAAADLDGDGRPDLILASPKTGRLTVLLNRSR